MSEEEVLTAEEAAWLYRTRISDAKFRAIYESHEALRQEVERLRGDSEWREVPGVLEAFDDPIEELCELRKQRDLWQEDARRYAENAGYWRERAEVAEERVAALTEALRGLVDGYGRDHGPDWYPKLRAARALLVGEPARVLLGDSTEGARCPSCGSNDPKVQVVDGGSVAECLAVPDCSDAWHGVGVLLGDSTEGETA